MGGGINKIGSLTGVCAACSCNFDGSDRRVILEGADTLPHPFALSVFDDTLFWTDWQTRAIHSCDKLTGTRLKEVHTEIFSPMDIHVYHARRQPDGQSRHFVFSPV